MMTANTRQNGLIMFCHVQVGGRCDACTTYVKLMRDYEVFPDCDSRARYAKALTKRIDEAIIILAVVCAAWITVAEIIHAAIDFDLLPPANGRTSKFPRYLCAMWDCATSACECIHAIAIRHRPVHSAALSSVIDAALVCIIHVTQPSTASASPDVVTGTANVVPGRALSMTLWICSIAIEEPA